VYTAHSNCTAETNFHAGLWMYSSKSLLLLLLSWPIVCLPYLWPCCTVDIYCWMSIAAIVIVTNSLSAVPLALYGLTQYVPTGPISGIPNPKARCLLPLLFSSRLLPQLLLFWIYTILRHNMNILTVNMHWQTAAWYLVFCLFITGPVCRAIAQ